MAEKINFSSDEILYYNQYIKDGCEQIVAFFKTPAGISTILKRHYMSDPDKGSLSERSLKGTASFTHAMDEAILNSSQAGDIKGAEAWRQTQTGAWIFVNRLALVFGYEDLGLFISDGGERMSLSISEQANVVLSETRRIEALKPLLERDSSGFQVIDREIGEINNPNANGYLNLVAPKEFYETGYRVGASLYKAIYLAGVSGGLGKPPVV